MLLDKLTWLELISFTILSLKTSQSVTLKINVNLSTSESLEVQHTTKMNKYIASKIGCNDKP